jgi:hypothetical protein
MKALVFPLVGLATCQLARETPSIPWLQGLGSPVASDVTSDEVARRIDTWSELADVDPECSTGNYPGIAIEADVAPTPGLETVMVSLAHGIVVTDREGALITEAPGYHCEGSADELEAVAAGDAYGAPTIAIAVTSGGHRESETWVTLFRVDDRRLDPVFTGTVEQRRGNDLERGSVMLLPGALLYRAPGGEPTLWFYNSDAHAYVQPGQGLDDHHDGPTEIPQQPTVSAR